MKELKMFQIHYKKHRITNLRLDDEIDKVWG